MSSVIHQQVALTFGPLALVACDALEHDAARFAKKADAAIRAIVVFLEVAVTVAGFAVGHI